MAKLSIKILGGWLILSSLIITVLNSNNSTAFARLMMAWGLILTWVVGCGLIMYKGRDRFKKIFESLPGKWTTKFFLFCLTLALLEEALATILTNSAPIFGASVTEAYITGSTNFLQVITHHSVIIFLPFFAAWVWLLKRYNFSPNQVFWTFGLTGLFIEAVSFGGIAEFGLWIFVYGLMVYLPTYCIPKERGAKPVKFYHFPLVILVSAFYFVLLYAFAVIWKTIGLPRIPNFGPDLVKK